MEPFTCFMDVDSSRSYINDLYSDDDNNKIQDSLIYLKNIVIGSDKQKTIVITQGIVPRLMFLLSQDSTPLPIRYDAAIVLGSLSKGSDDNVRSLIEAGLIQVLLKIVTNLNADKHLMEICLCVVRSIYEHPFAPKEIINTTSTLSYLIGLASPENTIQCQACVANILVPICHNSIDQKMLCKAGAIPLLARLITTRYTILQIPALKCLAAMCFTNKYVSDIVCVTNHEERSIPDILSTLTSRARIPEIQIAAARCLTYIHRSGSLSSTDSRIVYKTLPCLARLCTEEFEENIRATAAETLAYLAEIDSELQRLAAISNHLINSLSNLLQCSNPAPRQGAFRCFASLGANDEEIRKRIIEKDGIMEEVLAGLGDPCADVRLAAVRCLHSLSRSVQQLRTTFQDHLVWRPLMALSSGSPSNELLTVVTSTICNLLLEFSPAKEPMVELGAIELLCQLTQNSELALRLNGVWALMNMTFQTEEHIKTKIINTLGTDRIFQLLNDSDTGVIMKTLGLLRNLMSKSTDIDNIMSGHSDQLMHMIITVLESPHTPEIKEQALCIIGNIAAGAGITDYVMENERILKKLFDFINHKDVKLQEGAMFAIKNLIEKSDLNTPQRLSRLQELGIIEELDKYLNSTSRESSRSSEDIRAMIRRIKSYSS
ncbi:armadillo repeat-containing protein 8-like isoform X1 [Sitodiplosis mosellana]|uniref:armadillo repeat-containing protein 8-like isoform X1 n=1 Tax=Sitodiplosis mosellana TaxID=263140 RepID=UPI002443A034|nr:armadillo repeat-containing protein 8-like isoform X1 [Sitodiplosis mosellana]